MPYTVVSISLFGVVAAWLQWRYRFIAWGNIPAPTKYLSLARYADRIERRRPPISIIDPRTGRFVVANRSFATALGIVSKQDIVGWSPWDFSPCAQPGGASSFNLGMTQLHRALEQGPREFEWAHTDAQGRLMTLRVALDPVELQGEWYVRAIFKASSAVFPTRSGLSESKFRDAERAELRWRFPVAAS